MPPTFDQLLDPLLLLAATVPITRRSATEAMIAHFELAPDETAERTIGGATTVIGHRTQWALSRLAKAGLIEKLATGAYRASSKGISLRTRRPGGITLQDLDCEPVTALEGSCEPGKPGVSDPRTGAATPAEMLDAALQSVNNDLKARLMDAILDQSVGFFERLVVDLLVAMGYGGSTAIVAEQLGQSPDGIDGLINQDPLGFDRIFVQARRCVLSQAIDRKMMQAFAGWMIGQGISKGLFITTSTFDDDARALVDGLEQSRVLLVDGNEFLDLLVRHRIGVRVEQHIERLDVDQNYFSEGDA